MHCMQIVYTIVRRPRSRAPKVYVTLFFLFLRIYFLRICPRAMNPLDSGEDRGVKTIVTGRDPEGLSVEIRRKERS